MISTFRVYDKEELFKKIDGIDITKVGETVVTKYLDRIVSITSVSDRYEIFDIRTFLKSRISQLEGNFNIIKYKFIIKRGIQELVLLSDDVDINGDLYYKSFFILNSSDKSRRLNMNMGLYKEDSNSYIVNSIKNMSLCRKHVKGVTKAADDVSTSINVETFNEQIDSIKSLMGERILLSNIKNIIIDKDLKINHIKFNSLKNRIKKLPGLTSNQINILSTPSESLNIGFSNDFSIDAYDVFKCYISLFSNQDSFIVKKETEKIMRITQFFIRDEKLKQLLDV